MSDHANPFINPNTITICFGDRYRCIARPASYRALKREGREAFPDMSAVYSIVVLFQIPELPDRWVELSPDAYAIVRGGAVLHFNVQHPITKQYILPLPDQDPDAVVSTSQTPNNGAHHRETSGTLNHASDATPRPDTAGGNQVRPPTTVTRPPLGPYNTCSKGGRSMTSAFADLRGGGDVCGSGWGAASHRLRQSARLVPSRKECKEGWGFTEGASIGYPDEDTADDDEEKTRKNAKQEAAYQQRDNCVNKCSHHCGCTLCLQKRDGIVPTHAFTTVRPSPGSGNDSGWGEGPRDGAYVYGKTPVHGSSVSNQHIGNARWFGGPSLCESIGFRLHQEEQRAAALWDSKARSVQRGVGRMSPAPSAAEGNWGPVSSRGGLGPFAWRQASIYDDRHRGTSRGNNQGFSVSCSGPTAYVQRPPPGFSREYSIYQDGCEDGHEGYQRPRQAQRQPQQPYSYDAEHEATFSRNQTYGGWAPVWPCDCEISPKQKDTHGCQYQYQHDKRRTHAAGSMTTKEARNLNSVRTSSNAPPSSIEMPANPPPPPSSSSHFHPAKYATGSPRKSRTKARLSSAWAAGRKRREGRKAADTWDCEQQFKQVYHGHIKQDQSQRGQGGVTDHRLRGNVGSTTDHHTASEHYSAATEGLEEDYHDSPERGAGDEDTEYYHHAGEYNTSRAARQDTASDPVHDENFGENSGDNPNEYDGQDFSFHLLVENGGGDDEPTEADAAPAPSHIPRARWPEYWGTSPPPTEYKAPETTNRVSASKASKNDGSKAIADTAASGQERDEKRKKHGKKSADQSGFKQSGMKNVTTQWPAQATKTRLKKLMVKEQTAPAAAAGASKDSCTYQHQCLCDRCTSERCCIHYIRNKMDEKDEWGEKLGGQGWCACNAGCPEHNHLRFW